MDSRRVVTRPAHGSEVLTHLFFCVVRVCAQGGIARRPRRRPRRRGSHRLGPAGSSMASGCAIAARVGSSMFDLAATCAATATAGRRGGQTTASRAKRRLSSVCARCRGSCERPRVAAATAGGDMAAAAAAAAVCVVRAGGPWRVEVEASAAAVPLRSGGLGCCRPASKRRPRLLPLAAAVGADGLRFERWRVLLLLVLMVSASS